MVQKRRILGYTGFFGADPDRWHAVAGLAEAGRSRCAGVTDAVYNCRGYVALKHVGNRRCSEI
jgi:hypothetical protein